MYYHCDFTFNNIDIKDTPITIIGRNGYFSYNSGPGIFYQEWWNENEHVEVGSLH